MNFPINSDLGMKIDLFSSLHKASFGPNVMQVANAIENADLSQFSASERSTLSTLTGALAQDGDISGADARSILSTMDAFSCNQSIMPGGCWGNSGMDFSNCLKPLLNAVIDALSQVISQASDNCFQCAADNMLSDVASSPWKGAVEGAFENVDMSKLDSGERRELLSMLSVASADGKINYPEANVLLDKLNKFTDADFCCEPPCCPSEGEWTVEQNGSTAEIDLGNYTLEIDERRSQFILTDKETGESSRVWGDPHFDMDNDGKTDMDFWGTMTMNLKDGTKITIDTTPWKGNENMTVSSKLTITQGDQMIVVDNMDQNKRGDMTIEHSATGGRLADALTADGLDIYAAGDGTEWKVLDGFEFRDVTKQDMAETKGDNPNHDLIDAFEVFPNIAAIADNFASLWLQSLFGQND